MVTGTSLQVDVKSPVDGDTVKVLLNGNSENLRILSLDTEESFAGSSKPVTPWGLEAKAHAAQIFTPGKTITIEFPGKEPVDIAIQRYRGNFGRPLVYVHVDDMDFQEHMIAEGYSPYFTKYGFAHFPDHDQRYRQAERVAQAAHIGVWNQVAVNGSEQRNYETLGAWWELRANVIEGYRRARADGAEILSSRLDISEIESRAADQTEATVFTELSGIQRVGSGKAIVETGSRAQPFKLFLPDIDSDDGQQILQLLNHRYISQGSDGRTITRPRRSYAYVTAPLKVFNGEPEAIVTSTQQIQDTPA